MDRLVEEAIVRFMPAEARRRREAAADGRHASVHTDQVSFEGTVWVEAEVDLADALDLDTALSVGAARLADLGSTASLDVRRSEALGQIARAQLALDLDTSPERRPQAGRWCCTCTSPTRRSPAATTPCTWPGWRTPARFVGADQVRAWCGAPDTTITVKPIIDLTEHIHVGQYEVPDRLAAQTEHRDHTCVFPWCTRPAEACDKDHVIPYAEGGPTASDNLGNLCRRHHRLKTHHPGWRYTMLEPGTYLWSSPHGYQFLRDHRGTTDVTRARPSGRVATPPHTPPPHRGAGPPACPRSDQPPATTSP